MGKRYAVKKSRVNMMGPLLVREVHEFPKQWLCHIGLDKKRIEVLEHEVIRSVRGGTKRVQNGSQHGLQ